MMAKREQVRRQDEPAESVGHEAAAEAADHAADGEDGDGDRVDDLLAPLGDVRAVPARVRALDEVLDHLRIWIGRECAALEAPTARRWQPFAAR